MGKFNSKTTNMDEVVYRFVTEKMRDFKNIEFHADYGKFYQIAKVWDWRFMLIHGDQIRMHLNLPWYGVTTRSMRLQEAVENFEYLCLGHFHNPAMIHWINNEIFMNGCFVTDDQWALANLGMSGQPKQLMFFVHPKQGVSARYLIKLD